jgi:hypothetical protein
MSYLNVSNIGDVLADAVFVSGLRRCDKLSAGEVRQAVGAAIRAFGCSGCAGRVAQEFGDHPETAVIRMRWARSVAREAFADADDPAGSHQVARERRLVAHLRAGDGDAAAPERGKHLRGLVYVWRPALASSQAVASKAMT